MLVPRSNGLEGVVVADTVLSDVDGEAGRLVLRGATLEQLAGRVGFEDVCALLVHGELPSVTARKALSERIGAARSRAFELLPRVDGALDAPDSMDALRGAVAQLGAFASNGARDASSEGCTAADDAELVEMVAAVGVFAAAWMRRREGLAAVPPDPRATHAADYLAMARGPQNEGSERSAAALAEALDAYFVTVVDHGLNASTFAARVVTSTGSDVVSAITAAIGALKGPLHGGAPGPVLDMLDAIGRPDRARAWLTTELAAGRRIMGFGHRVYRTRDPRASVLEHAVEKVERALASAEGPEACALAGRLELARTVEREAETLLAAHRPARALRANVEFYTAVLLESLGIPREAFSATFAASRVAGWCAHVGEQRRAGRLIRPASRYVGPPPS
jgi:citrate synthase